MLVKLMDEVDPESGERFTVKRYESEKSEADDGTWMHLKISLKPSNSEFKAIELTGEDEGEVEVVGEFLEVLE